MNIVGMRLQVVEVVDCAGMGISPLCDGTYNILFAGPFCLDQRGQIGFGGILAVRLNFTQGGYFGHAIQTINCQFLILDCPLCFPFNFFIRDLPQDSGRGANHH